MNFLSKLNSAVTARHSNPGAKMREQLEASIKEASLVAARFGEVWQSESSDPTRSLRFKRESKLLDPKNKIKNALLFLSQFHSHDSEFGASLYNGLLELPYFVGDADIDAIQPYVDHLMNSQVEFSTIDTIEHILATPQASFEHFHDLTDERNEESLRFKSEYISLVERTQKTSTAA